MILVTGSSGLIGSHILYDLIARKEKVRALYRSESRKERVQQLFSYYNEKLNQTHNYDDIEWFKADIMDLKALN